MLCQAEDSNGITNQMFGFVWKQGEGGAVTAALLRAVGRQWRAIRTEALQVLQRQQSSAPGALAATVREGEGLHERGQVRKQVFWPLFI